MKRLNVLFSGLFFCALVAWTAPQAKAQINLTGSGPSPSSLQVKTGSSIGFSGVRKGEFYGGTVTSAPAGSAVAVGGNPQWLAGCLDFGFTADVAGTYSYDVIYNGRTYTGSVIATTGDTVYVAYIDSGSSASRYYGPIPNALNVNVGDVVVFTDGRECIIGPMPIALTSVPNGAANPAPSGSGYCPLTYPITVEGTYTFYLGNANNTGSITAIPASSAAVGSNAQQPGFSMTVTPQPSNGTATISFKGDKPADLNLTLFDASGRQVHQYEDMKFGAGKESMPLSSATLPSGDYYLRAISGGSIVATTKVLIVH